MFTALLLLLLAAPPMPPVDDHPDLPPLAWAYEFRHTEEESWAAYRAARGYEEWLKVVRPYCFRYNREELDDMADAAARCSDAWAHLAAALYTTGSAGGYYHLQAIRHRREALRGLSKSIDPRLWAGRKMPPPAPTGWRP